MVTEILSGLWIGDLNDAFNEQFYKDNLITIAINCTIDQGFLDLPKLKKGGMMAGDDMDDVKHIQIHQIHHLIP